MQTTASFGSVGIELFSTPRVAEQLTNGVEPGGPNLVKFSA